MSQWRATTVEKGTTVPGQPVAETFSPVPDIKEVFF